MIVEKPSIVRFYPMMNPDWVAEYDKRPSNQIGIIYKTESFCPSDLKSLEFRRIAASLHNMILCFVRRAGLEPIPNQNSLHYSSSALYTTDALSWASSSLEPFRTQPPLCFIEIILPSQSLESAVFYQLTLTPDLSYVCAKLNKIFELKKINVVYLTIFNFVVLVRFELTTSCL